VPIIIELFEEFAERQACEHATIDLSRGSGNGKRKIVFANGATSDGQNSHTDPPKEPRALLEAKREYLVAKLDREVELWKRFKERCTNQENYHTRSPSYCPPGITDESTKQLKDGAARILQLKNDLAAIDAELVDPEEVRRQQEENARQSKRAMDHIESWRTFQEIEI
jgi:hypothetical protein